MPFSQPITTTVPSYAAHPQILDMDHDGAEIENELKLGMQEAQTARFYHDGFGTEQ